MPAVKAIHSAFPCGNSTFIADVTLDFSDIGGGEERCHYGVNASDPEPINRQLWAAIHAGQVAMIDPPPQNGAAIPLPATSCGGPDVID